MPSRRRRWVAAASLVAAAAIASAACGGASGPSGARSEGAAHVPAGTVAYLSLDTELESAKWQALAALVDRFPSGAEVLDRLADLGPALGPEVGLALLGPAGGAHPAAVVVTDPAEPAALEQALDEEGLVWDTDDGWYVLGRSRAAVDRAVAGADEASLAETDRYRAAVDGLPADAVATLYASGTALLAGAPASGLTSLAAALGAPEALGLAAVAEPQGVRLVGALPGALPPPAPLAPELPAVAPADALSYASVSDLAPAIERLAGASQLGGPLAAGLADLLAPVVAGEAALVVGPGAPRPVVTLLLAPRDPQAAAEALDELVESLGTLAPLLGGEAPSLTLTPVTVAGIEATRIELGADRELFAALVGDHVVLTSAEDGLAAIAADDVRRLAEDPRFLSAVAASGMPSETSAFAWVDLTEATALAAADLEAELSPLGFVLLYALPGASGGVSLAGYLGVE